MKRAVFLLFILFLAGCTALTGGQTSKTEGVYTKITAEEAWEMMQDGEAYILLDVRTPSEFDEGHIEGAILLPDFEITKKAESVLPDKNARILLYCRSGRRSAEAAKKLIEMGYTKVFDFGGILDWEYKITYE
jgi:phage shock protein E